jgi:DNA-directed RNA polymerase subunit RPC12/RpoP
MKNVADPGAPVKQNPVGALRHRALALAVMLRTPQCPGIVSGWLLSFLWPLAVVGVMLALHPLIAGASDLGDGVVWGFAFLAVAAAICKPLHHALARLNLRFCRMLHAHNPYACPNCGSDIHMTPHRCPECGAKLQWGELAD